MANYRVIFHDGMEDDDHLEHFGIKGMRWGVRRYQNYDGSLTPEGKRHYGNYKENLRRGEALIKETSKHMRNNKRFSDDFGGSANNIDDWEYALMVAKERLGKEEFSSFEKAYDDWASFARKNGSSISEGAKIARALSKKRKKK